MTRGWVAFASVMLLVATVSATGNNSRGADAAVAYRDVAPRGTYRSQDSFDAKGMGNLYAIVDIFLDAARPSVPPRDAFANSSAVELVKRIGSMDPEVMWYYARFVSLAGLGLLLAIAVPIAGLAFCVCRCSCRCSTREPPGDKDRDACKRLALGIILFVLVTVVLFGIVCAFVTNEYFEHGVRQVDPVISAAIEDLNLYLNNTQRAVDNLLVTNFHELRDQLDALLNGCGERVKTKLAEISSAVAIDNLTTIVSGLDAVRADLDSVVQHTTVLRDKGQQLEQALNGIRERLGNHLGNCLEDVCEELRKKFDLSSLTVRPEVLQPPKFADVAGGISQLVREDIEVEVKKGKQALDGIGQSIQRAVGKTIPEVQQVVRNVGVELAKISKDMGEALRKFHFEGERTCLAPECNPDIETFTFARYCLGMAMCLVLFIVTFFVIGGLLCGFCGRKTSIYTDDSCTKGTGSKFLMVAVYFIFTVYLFLMAATTALFVSGGLMQNILCDSLDGSSPQALIAGTNYIVKSVDSLLRNPRLPENVPDIIARCHQNLSIYQVLQLQRAIDIDDVGDYKRRFHIDAKVAELTRRVNLEPGITLLTPNARKQLSLLAESRISDIDFAAYADTLKQGIVKMDISQLTSVLGNMAQMLETSHPSYAATAHSLRNEIVFLEGIQERLLSVMITHSAALKGSLENLQRDIGNKNSFRQAVTDLIRQADDAQAFIQTEGKSRVIELAKELAKDFTSLLDEYAHRATVQVKEEIGNCWPISKAVNATVVVACKSVVQPFNGFWASVGWCLLLFVPILIVAVGLADLYKVPEPYAIPLTESNRDGRRRTGRKQESYDNQNGYPVGYSPTSPTAPPVGNGLVRRGDFRPSSSVTVTYEDYELGQPRTFRNSKAGPVDPIDGDDEDPRASWGLTSDPPPPQYSSANSLQEFERPPPYYYPGP